MQRVGREKRVADAGGKDDYAAFFKVPDGSTPNVRLGNLVHKYGSHYATLNAALLERVLQGDRVDNRGKHAHVVRSYPVHLFGLRRHTTEKIAAPDHNPDFDYCLHSLVEAKFSNSFSGARMNRENYRQAVR